METVLLRLLLQIQEGGSLRHGLLGTEPTGLLFMVLRLFISDTRVIAGSILADYLKSEEMRRSAEVRAIMERHTTRALFCPDEPTIKILTYQLFRKEETDISCETLLKFLCWNYRNQSLETCETVSNNRWNFIKRGFFRGKEVRGRGGGGGGGGEHGSCGEGEGVMRENTRRLVLKKTVFLRGRVR